MMSVKEAPVTNRSKVEGNLLHYVAHGFTKNARHGTNIEMMGLDSSFIETPKVKFEKVVSSREIDGSREGGNTVLIYHTLDNTLAYEIFVRGQNLEQLATGIKDYDLTLLQCFDPSCHHLPPLGAPIIGSIKWRKVWLGDDDELKFGDLPDAFMMSFFMDHR